MTAWLTSLSPTLRIGLTLLAIVALIRARLPMWAAFLSGGVLLALFFPMSLPQYGHALLAGATSQETIFLMLVVAMILTLSAALGETGQTERIIGAFRALVGTSRLTLVTFPMLIGLLPMPGGAVFSAPMVEAAVKGARISPARKTIANYWFRHPWEYWLPIYPGVILCLTLTRAPVASFIALQLPMAAISLAAGYAIILHGLRMGGERQRDYSPANLRRFGRELFPYTIVVLSVAAVGPLAEALADALVRRGAVVEAGMLLRRWPVLLGLALATAWLFAFRGLRPRAYGRMFLKKHVAGMLSAAACIMVLQTILKRCGAVEQMQAEFAARNVPAWLVAAALPFVAGMTVGIGIGFVGASFPLILPLIAAQPAGERLAWCCFAYSMGYAGMMVSPVHICLLLTNQYFKSNLARVYAYLAPLTACIVAATFALFAFYRWLF